MDLIGALNTLSVSHRRSLKDDDFFVDRLHHRYTVAALVLFCAVVTTNQYAGEPINCWVPAQFTGSFETYTNRLCWLQNTYFVDEHHDIPDHPEQRYEDMLKYYQWIHLIILLQSLLFLIPRIIWRTLNDKCGIEIVNYVDAAKKYETVDKFGEREKIMEFLTSHITTFINARDRDERTSRRSIAYIAKRTISYVLFWTGKRFGNYLLILYMFTKVLYLVNVIGQLFLITELLGIESYPAFGIEILQRMSQGKDMIHNAYFPKVTHCDFKVRELGTDHQYTVQCVLTINIFIEKIYIIVWFWFIILSMLTIIDLLGFMVKNFWPQKRVNYITKHVRIFSVIAPTDHDVKKKLHEFGRNFLLPDVVLVLRILSTNVNGMVVSELIKRLWDGYSKNIAVEEEDELLKLEAMNGEDYDDNSSVGTFPKRDLMPHPQQYANAADAKKRQTNEPLLKNGNNPVTSV